MATSVVEVMLGRRPAQVGVSAFGHVDVSSDARKRLADVLAEVTISTLALKSVPFHPDDLANEDEVLTAPLRAFDSWFQAQAEWSLERTVAELRKPKLPMTLDAAGVAHGAWSFYAVRAAVSGRDVVLVRAKSPSWGLRGPGKIITVFAGDHLELVESPLIAFDATADVLVVEDVVYVLNPRTVERLFVDAEAVKARAPQTAQNFDSKVGATLTAPTVDAIQRVCSHNANVARRVERLLRDGQLANVTAAKVRAALPDAGLRKIDFGTSGPIQAVTDGYATVLIDIAADLYYQPRFDRRPRRVAAYRKI